MVLAGGREKKSPVQVPVVLRAPQDVPENRAAAQHSLCTGKQRNEATHDLWDPGADQVHLVQVGGQRLEAQGEGGLRRGASTARAERTQSTWAHRRPRTRPGPRPRLRGPTGQSCPGHSAFLPHSRRVRAGGLPPLPTSEMSPRAHARAELPGGHRLWATVW